jgi:hypothetical protein
MGIAQIANAGVVVHACPFHSIIIRAKDPHFLSQFRSNKEGDRNKVRLGARNSSIPFRV